ncbi:MAG: hypothetical protein RMX96_31245 [Nostoc sp. ChiSLP02]|nr:hypothetical protein [Nostoc sp. DedSLP05]MDZ8100717.1 hypothetical protein [Nostoc sp. DedSLP01]MDZ8189302.1 hypothetical protein [Nostoc sp. ChiSLP02]
MNQPSVRANLTPEYDYAVIAENFVKELRENRPRGISGLAMNATTTPALTDNKTLNEVVNCLTENIPIKSQGKCEQRNIFEI